MDDLGILPSILGHPHISIYIYNGMSQNHNQHQPTSTSINQHQPTSTNIHNILNILTLTTATTFRMAFGVTFQVISKNWASVLGFSMFWKACKLVSLLQKEAELSQQPHVDSYSPKHTMIFQYLPMKFAITICDICAFVAFLRTRKILQRLTQDS